MKRTIDSVIENTESMDNENFDLKSLDLQIATEIAGFAGIDVRDRRGNLSPEVWVRHSDKMSVGQLIESSDIRQVLLKQLENHLGEQRELLQQLEDNKVVVRWVLDFIDTWEELYKERVNRNFDISQRILTAMQETMHEVKPALEDVGISWSDTKKIISNIAQDNTYFFDPENALVRFFYRNPITGPPLRRLAGKTLQKSIVCNKAGTYSAKVQRNDITQERSYAERAFLLFIQNEDSEMEELKNSIEDGSFAK